MKAPPPLAFKLEKSSLFCRPFFGGRRFVRVGLQPFLQRGLVLRLLLHPHGHHARHLLPRVLPGQEAHGVHQGAEQAASEVSEKSCPYVGEGVEL